jgi:c(7)-type cytochrome triheme protein
VRAGAAAARRAVLGALGLAALLAGASAFPAVAQAPARRAPEAAVMTVPPDFPMRKAESSPGQVTFSHATHRAAVGKCSTCHMRDFKMKRGGSGPITLDAKQEGRFCGACHDGKTTLNGRVVFPIDDCDKCHK